jgi:hypothetical protein
LRQALVNSETFNIYIAVLFQAFNDVLPQLPSLKDNNPHSRPRLEVYTLPLFPDIEICGFCDVAAVLELTTWITNDFQEHAVFTPYHTLFKSHLNKIKVNWSRRAADRRLKLINKGSLIEYHD